MTPDRASRFAWPVAWVAIASNAIGLVGFGVTTDDLALAIISVAGGAFFAVLGALIASRTGNAIGWLYIALAAVAGTTFTVEWYAEQRLVQPLPGAAHVGAFSEPMLFTALALFVAVFFLFPTGRIASPRWRWAWWLYVGAALVNFAGWAIQPRPVRIGNVDVANPLGVDSIAGALNILLGVAGSLIALLAFVAFASLVFRFRNGSPDVRQQIRWLVAIGAVAGVAFVLLVGTGIPMENAEATGRSVSQVLVVVNNIAFFLLAASVVIGIPLATTIAILRFRLYHLDVVIRRTVVFAVLAGFVTFVYVGIVVVLSRLVGEDSLLLSIVATAVVAALFQPVRGWATRFANRLVYGRRAEPYEVLARFSDRVGETYAAEDVLPRMARVIAEGVGAERAEVWLGDAGDARLAAAWPVESAPIAEAAMATTAVRHEGTVLGEIRVHKAPSDPIAPTEEKLLADLAAQAGLVVRNVGLTVDLEAKVARLAEQADELQASRMRIVQAHDAERRRLERNIHDGAQQHLVALAVKLRLARSLAEKDPGKAADMLRTLADETGQARETLLDLASGIYPAVLEEQGVAEALRGQASPTGATLTVDADGIGRFPIETEAAVYFVCLEAMQNAAKYARAAHIDVRLGLVGSSLTFEVADDGVGFDASSAETGSGLPNMRDRLAAFGGDVEISSEPGRGTTVRGSLPLPEEVRR